MLTAVVRMQVLDPQSGVMVVDVLNQETIQIPGQGPLGANHGELFANVIDRLAEDVKDRSMEQAREWSRTP